MSRRIAAEITHKLHSCLDYIGGKGVFLRIDNPVIAFIGFCHTGKSSVSPVKFPAVYDNSAYLYGVTVHILGGRMNYNIRSPLNRAAKNRRCKGVIHYQGNAVSMSGSCPHLYVKNGKGGICQCFAENRLCVILKCGVQLLLRSVLPYPNALYAHLFKGNAEKIYCAAVY